MSKWVQFYHKINKFDLVNMRFTDEVSVVEMVGMDSVMPILLTVDLICHPYVLRYRRKSRA